MNIDVLEINFLYKIGTKFSISDHGEIFLDQKSSGFLKNEIEFHVKPISVLKI